MKKIIASRKLLNVSKTADLKELKSVYRNFMKEFHPDKFQGNEEERIAAEHKSKEMIEAYHFLVSVHPETIEAQLPDYTNTTETSIIADANWKYPTLTINFSDGSSYEYFDVPKPIYVKMINSTSQARFAKRNIYFAYTYRKLTNVTLV